VEKDGNATQAALVSYNVKDTEVARAVGAEVLARPRVKAAITALLDDHGLTDSHLVDQHTKVLGLIDHEEVQKKALGFKALGLAYRLKGHLDQVAAPSSGAMPSQVVTVLIQVLNELKTPQDVVVEATLVKDEAQVPDLSTEKDSDPDPSV